MGGRIHLLFTSTKKRNGCWLKSHEKKELGDANVCKVIIVLLLLNPATFALEIRLQSN